MASLLEKSGALIKELRRRRVLRVAAVYIAVSWVLLQVAETAFPALQLPDWSVTLVVVLTLFGFPIAMVLAWAFDLTPEGVVLTPDPQQPEPLAAFTPDGSGKGHPRESVAVLPFTNVGGEQEHAYFAEGIHEEVIARLARIRALRVVSRTSVMGYRDTTKNVREVGQELRVGTVLEGSVRQAPQRVRISAQLIDAHSDGHLWSEMYDRGLEDIFDIQTEVATRIASALETELSPGETLLLTKSPTDNLEAYDLYLRGRFSWNQRTESGLEAAVGFLREAVDLAPDFALAFAALADAYAVLGIYNAKPPQTVMPLALSAADRALALDPTLGEAHASRGCVRSIHYWDWDAGRADFKSAIELSPSYATARQWYAMQNLAPLGRFGEAQQQLADALELDPLSPVIKASIAFVHYLSRDHEKAISCCDDILESGTDFAVAHFFKGQALEQCGQHARAVEALERAQRIRGRTPEMMAALGQAYAVAGDEGNAEAQLAELLAASEHRYVSKTRIAQIYLGLGRNDEALEQLELAYAEGATDLIWLGSAPIFDSLRSEARFNDLLDRVRLR